MHANIGLEYIFHLCTLQLYGHFAKIPCLLLQVPASQLESERRDTQRWMVGEHLTLVCVCVVQGVRVGVGMGGSDGWQSPAEHIAPLIKAALQSTCSWGCIFSLWLPPHFTIIFKSENWFKCQKEWCPSSYCTSPLSSINSYIHTMWLSIGVCCFLF